MPLAPSYSPVGVRHALIETAVHIFFHYEVCVFFLSELQGLEQGGLWWCVSAFGLVGEEQLRWRPHWAMLSDPGIDNAKGHALSQGAAGARHRAVVLVDLDLANRLHACREPHQLVMTFFLRACDWFSSAETPRGLPLK